MKKEIENHYEFARANVSSFSAALLHSHGNSKGSPVA